MTVTVDRILWTVNLMVAVLLGGVVLDPVSPFAHFFFLHEKVEVHLCNLELSDITVGSEAGG